MNVYYSILFFNYQLNSTYYEQICNYLSAGIKVFWFGTNCDVKKLRDSLKPFCDAFLLHTHGIDDISELSDFDSLIIVDGKGANESKLIDCIEKYIPAFNTAQYRVEHCLADTNIVVKASAGTGKTTVMIDRILYLMHMNPSLQMSDIYMITFTNEATNQMNDRLQQVLLKRYALTKNKRYLTWLEQQSQMNISTIDSLAYDLFKRFGSGVGFGRDLDIKPLEKERKDAVKDILSDNLSDSQPIFSQLAMSYSEASYLIDSYWKELTRKGYTISEVLNKNWGNEIDPTIANIQRVIKSVLNEFEGRYRQSKLDANAISINDLFFDFGHFLLDGSVDCAGLNMKYLFVDEFQDTDATQIKTFANLAKSINAKLFVVGDIKQSIYAFKGATDEAFDILDKEMGGNLKYFNLVNNYRTCANIMKIMEKYFYKWNEYGLLRYESSVRPFNPEEGHIKMTLQAGKANRTDQIAAVISNALYDLEIEVKSGRRKVDEKTKVAVLLRGNKKAEEIAQICRDNGMSVVLNSDKPFFLCAAVRDFYALISSFIFTDEPTYIYNYLSTPYANFEGSISASDMDVRNGDQNEILKYLNGFLSQTNWHKYQRDFRLKPVISVIKEIIENEDLIDSFIAMEKANLTSKNWTEASRNREVYNKASLYKMDLDKLMEILQQQMNGEFTTLYDIYVYLSLMIATNREELEPDLESKDDYKSVYIMTVHKSKGLEFDTVVMPSMNNNLIPWEDTTILINGDKVAWFFKRDISSSSIKSALYDELRKEYVKKGIAEETRVLYVAMTRAVNNLILILNDDDRYESWSSLIRKVGLINE